MKNLVRALLLGGAVIASTTVTAAPASAACYDYGRLHAELPDRQLICVGYDYCDAWVCVPYPL